MPKDRERRRRGRRGDRRDEPTNPSPEEKREESPAEAPEGGVQEEMVGDQPAQSSREQLRNEKSGGLEVGERETVRGRRTAERPAADRSASASPLSFWRRSQARPHRQQRTARRGRGSLRRRIAGFQSSAWVPVGAVIIVVFGILVLLFLTRSATGAPRSGDHWHAPYEISICGQLQPNVPRFGGGVHTHGDGVLHIHPQLPSEEGSGARLVRWFEYGGGRLTQDEMRIAGQSETVRNGDLCDDGSEGVLQVFVNGQSMDSWSRYIPQDGDSIRIVFGPDEGSQVSTDEGIVISSEEATREIDIEAGDEGNPDFDSFFLPSTFTINAGETVKVNVRNTGSVSHNLRIWGVDEVYQTEDDFVSRPLIILPGEEGFTVTRIDESGQYAFRCDIHPSIQFGTMTVAEDGTAPSQGTSTPEVTSAAP